MTTAPRAARFVVRGLLGSVALLPFLPVLARAAPVLQPLERAMQAWFDLHCERDPARTLSFHGVALGVCARCSGIYFGFGSGALFCFPRLTPARLRRWVLAAAVSMLSDVMLERHSLHGSWPALRVATGFLLAYPVGVALATLLARPRR